MEKDNEDFKENRFVSLMKKLGIPVFDRNDVKELNKSLTANGKLLKQTTTRLKISDDFVRELTLSKSSLKIENDRLMLENKTILDESAEREKIQKDMSWFNNATVVGHAVKREAVEDGKEVKEKTDWINLGADEAHIEPRRTLSKAYRDDAKVMSYLFYDTTPFGKSFVKNLTSYVFGRGMKFITQSEEVNSFLEKFWAYNDLEKEQEIIYEAHVLNGETCLAFNNQQNKEMLSCLFIPSAQVEAVYSYGGDISKTYGLARLVQNLLEEEQKVFYKHIFTEHVKPPDGLDKSLGGLAYEKDEDTQVNWLKEGHKDETRGLPYMYATFKWLRMGLELGKDRMSFLHFRQLIYMKRKHLGRKPSGGYADTTRMPKGGTVLNEDTTTTYDLEYPEIGNIKDDWMIIMYFICAGLRMPPHILFQDASNNNYASIRKADTPFANYVLDEQDTQRHYWTKNLRHAISWAVAMGKLPPKIKIKVYKKSSVGESINALYYVLKKLDEGAKNGDIFDNESMTELIDKAKAMLGGEEEIEINTVDIPIDCIFPDVVHEDPLVQVKAVQTLVAMRLMSRYTAQRKTGLDPGEERARIEDEKVQDADAFDNNFADKMNTASDDEEDEEKL